MDRVFPVVGLGEAARPVERPEAPIPGREYRQIGVKLWGQGAYERETIDGSQTKYGTLWRVEADDIIVNKIWARNGSVAVVPPHLAGCYGSNEFPTFAPIPGKLLPRWFHWLTKTAGFWEQCDEKSRGTSGQNRIRPERFLEITIPLPPLDEQRRIVARIDALAARIEEARGLRRQAAAEVDKLRNAGAKAIFSNHLWGRTTLEELVGRENLRNGRSLKSVEQASEFSCLRISAMRNGRINTQDTKPIMITAGEAQPYLVQQDDVFVVRGNGSAELVGRAGWVDQAVSNVIFPDLFIKVPLDTTTISPAFFVTWWNSGEMRDRIVSAAKTTSGIWKINQKHMASMPIVLPSTDEQRRIVAYLDGLQAKVDAVKHLQAATAAELDALLPAVLDRAFKGDL